MWYDIPPNLPTTSDGELLGNHSQTWLTVSPHASKGESGRQLTTERLLVGIYRRTIEAAALARRFNAPSRLKDRRWVNDSIFCVWEARPHKAQRPPPSGWFRPDSKCILIKYLIVRHHFLSYESDPNIRKLSAPLSNIYIYNQGKTGNTVGGEKESFLLANGCRAVTGHAYNNKCIILLACHRLTTKILAHWHS